jgi:Penicillin-insensitive murein endopeptidase/Succinylglutamate desuccinylase / Aspartoacylase family
MLGDTRLAQPELRDELPNRASPLAEQVEDAATRRLSNDCERRHRDQYIQQVIYLSRHLVLVFAAAALCAGVAGAQSSASRSLGLPWAGSLVGGVQLATEGDHFFTWDPVRKRSPNRGWRLYGSQRLVGTTLGVLDAYAADNPDAPRVGIGDLSRRHGGDFGARFGGVGHASHQNGLDVDLYYPRRDRRERAPAAPRQIDRRLAQALLDRVVAAGAAKVFIGPNTRLRGPPAVVEVLPAYHDNHMHVRLPGDGVVRSSVVGESTRGQEIRSFTLGSGRPRIVVVGTVHGNEPAGSVVATRLLHAKPPGRGSITVVQDLNPDGHAVKRRANGRGVDLNRNFPGTWAPISTSGRAPGSEQETKVAMRLIRRLRPDVTIWFHQPQGLVRASGSSVPIARRYARLAGMRFARLSWPPGSATAWQHGALPGTRAFVVELAPGELGIREAGRYARAVLRLAGS